MEIQNKKFCVVCKSDYLEIFHTVKNVPICYIPHTDNIDYNYSDQIWGKCNNCQVVQLMSLIDPNILYNTAHNNTYDTPTWKLHHREFIKFIGNVNNKKILEIGGGSGYTKRLITGYDTYHIGEISVNNQPDYIEIDIEKQVPNNYDNCIMSHVFEHFYEPSNVVSNLSKGNIKNIYISIPDMDSLISTSYILNFEHTYYVNSDIINYIFSKNGYIMQETLKFNTVDNKPHSMFYHFVSENIYTDRPKGFLENPKTASCIPLIKSTDVIKNYLDKLSKPIDISNIKGNIYIMPGGYMGQIVYNRITDKSKLSGFLDNDKSKIGKILYGTCLEMFPVDICKEKDITVLLVDNTYTMEMQRQLYMLNSEINIIIV